MRGMDEEKNLARLGELIAREVAEGWPTQKAAADGIGVPLRSLANWMRAEVAPRRAVHEKLEEAFGWKRGSTQDVLSAEDPTVYTVDVLREDRPGIQSPRLREFSDESLLFEIGRRIANMRDQIREYEDTRDRAAHSLPPRGSEGYDLAASEDHEPDEAPED